MRTQKEQQEKQKIQNSLVFGQSDLWDVVNLILDKAIKQEVDLAINQAIDEEKRAHQSGRADALVWIKELLEDTRQEALRLKDRNAS
jgi:hypothetical protein